MPDNESSNAHSATDPDDRGQEASAEQRDPESSHELEGELERAREDCLRAKADLENFRMRSRRELDEAVRFANLPMMRDLLPVIDNLSRAVEAGEASDDAAGLLDGVRMVMQQLDEVLKKYHCREIAAAGEPFDPNLHEAVSQQPSEDHDDLTILSVLQSGYLLHDRVVRPAQVIVSRKEG